MRNIDISLLVKIADSYLASEITGSELVTKIDEIVAKYSIRDLPQNIVNLLDNFQDELSLFVRDEETKRESSGVYFCEDELPKKVKEFKKELLVER